MKVFLTLGLFFLVACSDSRIGVSTNAVKPERVNPAQVQSMVTLDASNAMICRKELISQAKILYENDMGLVMLDKRSSELKLSGCKASVSDNKEVKLDFNPTPKGQNETDLPTLLRLIPAEEIGARSFIKGNPNFDGRKVIVGILDTGIELDHPMLKVTSAGENKILDFADMSGEGAVALSKVIVSPEGTFKATDGATYSVKGIQGTDFSFGIFAGSTLQYSESLGGKDKFSDVAVISYQTPNGRRARIDTNRDRNFSDEVELGDFAATRSFTKLGEKKSLTTSVNLAEDGSSASLCFDDGTHGTHVAGISTGFDPKGLIGVAPGAQVVMVKIGDNRLAGGSTTTASMMLAIDYAVSKKVQIINMSYGIRAGSNRGKSAIDQYVDKVALEKGILFSISNGNEGPGLLTSGTPAAASLAISNGAYISKNTARDNYGYLGVEDDNIWYFSSVGPLLDGNLKPTLLAPGTAVSSVPPWSGGVANYRGTSMASPEVTGGLALILSAATQSQLPMDRPTVTKAVYRSAKPVAGLAFVEQGHGLMNVPAAVDALRGLKGQVTPEYSFNGIYVRARALPNGPFTVTVTPKFPAGTSTDVTQKLRTYKLVASDEYIKIPSNFWLAGVANKFQVDLDPAILNSPGLHSGKVSAIDESTNQVEFEVPVTVVSPIVLSDQNQFANQIQSQIKVGHTLRYFFDLPAGTTSVEAELSSDGPVIWGQLLDPEGRHIMDLRDAETTPPMPLVFSHEKIKRPGTYELDIVAPAYNQRLAAFTLSVTARSITTTQIVAKPGGVEVSLQNNFSAFKATPTATLKMTREKSNVEIKGGTTNVPFKISEEDKKNLASVNFNVVTAEDVYDLMTDYPFRVFDSKGALVASGGLELDSDIVLPINDKTVAGSYILEVTGSFTDKIPESFVVGLTEDRIFANAAVLSTGARILFDMGQALTFPVDFPKSADNACAVLSLTESLGRDVQDVVVCN